MAGSQKYAAGSEASGLCQKCGLRFHLRELVLDDYFPGLRVCESCYDTRQPQEFPISVGDPQALYRPSPEWQAIPSDLTGYGLKTVIYLNWNETQPQGGPRVDQYDLYRSDSTDGIFFDAPIRLIAFPVDYYADYGQNSLADLVDHGNPAAPNHGISFEVLTYEDEGVTHTGYYRYQIIARLNGGRLVASNTVDLQTTDYNAIDEMHTSPDFEAGTLITGVIFTSRPYPVQDIEQYHATNQGMLPVPLIAGDFDQYHGHGDFLGGSLDNVVQNYSNWPEQVADESYTAHGDFIAGTLDTVVVYYTNWPLAVSQETYHAKGDMVGGTVVIALIQYQNWPIEMFHTTPDFLGGTLA